MTVTAYILDFIEKVNPRSLGNIHGVLKKNFPIEYAQIIVLPGRTFIEKIYMYLNDLSTIPICEQCKKESRRYVGIKIGYDRCCSKKCKNELLDIENPNRHKENAAKSKATYLARTGYTCPAANPEVNKKIWETYKKRTGFAHITDNPNYMDSYKKKTGYDNPLANPEIWKQTQAAATEHFGCHQMQDPTIKKTVLDKRKFKQKEISKKVSETRNYNTYQTIKSFFENDLELLFTEKEYIGFHGGATDYVRYHFKCKACQHVFSSPMLGMEYVKCPKCFPTNYMGPQNEILDYIRSLGFNPIHNDRTIIKPLELDIVIPEKKIAIEFDGLFWHSQLNDTPKNYHLAKTEACTDAGYRLIHVFENEWNTKKKIVKARLRHILGCSATLSIGARKTEIREVSREDKRAFLEACHIQGDCRSKYNYGLFYKNRLVAIMTFSELRVALGNTGKTGFELTRFCQLRNVNVIGAASKLLKHFMGLFPNSEITSYADRRWSNGNVYEKLGFALDHISPPNYWYFKSGQFYHRFSFMKGALHKKLDAFDPSLTEWDNMKNNGWNRIFDCGNLVYVIK